MRQQDSADHRFISPTGPAPLFDDLLTRLSGSVLSRGFRSAGGQLDTTTSLCFHQGRGFSSPWSQTDTQLVLNVVLVGTEVIFDYY